MGAESMSFSFLSSDVDDLSATSDSVSLLKSTSLSSKNRTIRVLSVRMMPVVKYVDLLVFAIIKWCNLSGSENF